MSRLIMPSILNQGVQGGKIYIACINGGASVKYENGQWSDISPTPSSNYRMGGISDDGKKWILPSYGGRLWLWNGTQYVEQQPLGNTNQNWFTAAISGDGSKMIAGVYDGRIYYHNGTTWSEIQPAGNSNRYWAGSAMSFDGTKYMVGAEFGRLYRYDGSSFVEEQPAGNADGYWMALTMSKSGDFLLAGNRDARMYEKTVGGSWIEIQPAGNVNRVWRQVSAAPNGLKHAVSGWTASFAYTYFYNGSSWVDEGVYTGQSLSLSGSMANNGRRIIAALGGRLHINMNDGNGYVEHQPLGNTNQNWIHVMVNKGT